MKRNEHAAQDYHHGGNAGGAGAVGRLCRPVRHGASHAGRGGQGRRGRHLYNPPSEFPGICLTQFKDGSLRFDGGFAFYNPGRWAYDAAKGELRLALAPTPSLELSHAQIVQHQNLLRIEADKHTLVYGVTAGTKAIGLGGFLFYRDMPCPAST